MEAIICYVQEVIGHNITPAWFFTEKFHLRKFSLLVAIGFTEIIDPFIFSAPSFKKIHLCGVRKNNFIMYFFFNRFQVIIGEMFPLVAVAYDLCGMHFIEKKQVVKILSGARTRECIR
jgi:hypothetical protein